MIGNETGHLLKCVKLYRKCININEHLLPVLRINIAATSLKISCINLYSVKSDDETNLKIFTLKLWEKFRWGLTRVATRQGKVREIDFFSRSGNCQGIL